MKRHEWTVDDGAGARLDVWLAAHLPGCSRARAQDLIARGLVEVDGRQAKASHRLAPGGRVAAVEPPPLPAEPRPEPIALDVVYEDADLIVVDKPPGLVVHPAPGHPGGTLVNALLHHCRDLGGVGGVERPGIVHRLDKDTSGLMVVGKHDAAHRGLVSQFADGRVGKVYLAVVHGCPPAAGEIAEPIGRHPRNRQRMAVRPRGGRRAVSRYETLCCQGPAALLRVRIATGRTHQIRVHLAHIGYPVAGDSQYGDARRDRLLPQPPPRQLLHAAVLAFEHPVTGRPLCFVRPPPADMRAAIELLGLAAGLRNAADWENGIAAQAH